MAEHNLTGEEGEECAVACLAEKGYHILHTHWIWNKKELDIVASLNDVIVFVEVKTRSYIDFETPREAVGIKKQKNIITVANAYIETYDIEKEARFDVMIVGKKNDIFFVEEHIEDAFYPQVNK